MKKTSYHKETYGRWAGLPKGNKCNPCLCAEEVNSGYISHQCTRKRGYGPDSAFCKQHAKRFGHCTTKTN